LEQLERRGLARITNYGEFLEQHPPVCEVRIAENTSWSCAHGVDRWRRHCGCHVGRADWSQEWRAHLRGSMDWLRDKLADRYQRKAAELVRDPWAARNDYVEVLLDGSDESWARFLNRHCWRPLRPAEHETLSQLLELQRHAMLMYTSCGWFFDDASGIETRLVIGHAARVVELAGILFQENLEPGLLEKLDLVKSNIAERGNGASIYQNLRKPLSAAANDGAGREPEHWLNTLVSDWMDQFQATGSMTFETIERVLRLHKEAYRRDLETARRMYRTYPQFFEDLEPPKTRAAGA